MAFYAAAAASAAASDRSDPTARVDLIDEDDDSNNNDDNNDDDDIHDSRFDHNHVSQLVRRLDIPHFAYGKYRISHCSQQLFDNRFYHSQPTADSSQVNPFFHFEQSSQGPLFSFDYDWPIFLLARAFANWPFAIRQRRMAKSPLPKAKGLLPKGQKPRAPLEGGLGQGLGALSSPSPPPLGPDKPLGS